MRRSNFLRYSAMGVAMLLARLEAAGAQSQRGQQAAPQQYDSAARATVLHPAVVYVAADGDAQKISLVTPGHEVVVVERSGPWVKVFANADLKEKTNDERGAADRR